MAGLDIDNGGTEEFELPPRKKPKVSELPLSSAQRASIDGMLHTFKKKGEFDALRKKAFQQYNESAARGMFENALRTFTSDEIDREPVKYLKPDRRLAAPLLEGAAARGMVYEKTETNVDAYIQQYLVNAERTLREIRRKEVGDDAADEEETRGAKSDDVYATEAQQRRVDRAKKHVEDEKLRARKEVQERKKKEFEALKKKQEELTRETERLQREQKRRQEREEWKKAEKEREKERIKKYNEEREKAQKEVEEREMALQAEQEKKRKEKEEREQKRLEEEALNRLLREGERLAEKGRRPELERSESMEPPSRLRPYSNAPRNSNSNSRDDVRSQGLMPTSLTLRKGDEAESRQSRDAPASEDRRRRDSRRRSPSPYSRSRRDDDSDRRPRRQGSPEGYRAGTMRKESYYRDISAEREAWKARRREPGHETERGEEGEVVERASTRARSKSRDSYRQRDKTRSPPRRSYRERTRSRTPPPARRYRDRDLSTRRRERSRSPISIDRYVPGATTARRNRDNSRERDRDRDRDREKEKERKGERDRRERSRDRERDRDRERGSDRRTSRYEDRPRAVDIDRYVPGGSKADDERPRRRDRSRSRERRRERSRDSYREKGRERDRERDKERDRDIKEPDRDKDRDRDKERERIRERD